jgi:autotransporter-associated beta strand protein
MKTRPPFASLRLFEALADLFCGQGGGIFRKNFSPEISHKKFPLAAAMAVSVLVAMPTASATVYYWDSNGTTAGAGTAPTGTWGTSAFWSTSSAGTSATANNATTALDQLIFSAGTDATGTYTITVNGTRTAKQLRLDRGAITFSGGTINLSANATGSASAVTNGIVLTTNATSATISSNLTINGFQVFNIATGKTLTLNTGTFTRSAGASLNVLSTGTVASSMTGLSSLTNGILGPWATFNSTSSMRYATITSGNITGLTGTSAANAAAVTDTGGTFNYDVAAVGTLGSGASVNTLRYTGAAGTIAGDLTTNGLLNAGSGTATLSGNVTIGSTRELVVTPGSASFTISGVLKDNGGGASSLLVAQPGNSTSLGLTLSNNNTYSGGTTISNARLAISANNALGTGSVSVLRGGASTVAEYGGGLEVSNNITWSNNMTLAGQGYNGYSGALRSTSGNNTYNGTITIVDTSTRIASAGSGTLTLNGTINLSTASAYGNLFQHAGGDIRLGGNGITGSATSFNVLGSAGGTNFLILDRANAWASTMGLTMGAASSTNYGRMDLNGFDQTVTSLSAAGTDATQNLITNRSSTLATLTINNSSNTSTDSTFSGNLAITKTGVGILSLSGNNTYTGGTLVSGSNSRLDASHVSALGTGNVTITTTGGSAGAIVGLQTSGAFANNFTINGSGTGNGAIQGYGANTTLSGLVTLAGDAMIANRIAGSNGNLTLTGGITSGGTNRTLTLNIFGNATQTNNRLTISTNSVNLGTGGTLDIGHGLAVGGTGIYNLNVGSNTWGTTIVRGWASGGNSSTVTLNLGAANALGSSSSVLQLGNSTISLEQITVNLNGNNQTIGGLRSFNGTGSASANGTRTVTSANATTLTIDNSSATNYLYYGAISGNLSLVKNGTATQTLSGNNTYTGTTTVNAGVLTVSSLPGFSTNGRYFVANGATLGVYNAVTDADIASMLGTTNFAAGAAIGFDTTTASRTYSSNLTDTSQGALGLTKLGSNTLTLGGASANTYTGTTTVSAGTLTLDKTSGVVAVGGDLVLNGSSKLLYGTSKNEQIANTASITINGTQSVFNGSTWGNTTNANTFNETIASLTVRDGQFNTGTTSNWTVTGAGVFDGSSGDSRFAAFSGSSISFNSLSLTAMNGTAILTDADSFVLGGNQPNLTTLTVGSGGLTLNGSTLSMNLGSVASGIGSRLILNGNITTTGSSGSFIGSYNGTNGTTSIQLSSTTGSVNRTITTGSGANLTIGVAITNGNATTAGIIKDGLGTLTLSNNNTFTGGLMINSGTVMATQGITGAFGTASNTATFGGAGNGVLAIQSNTGLTLTANMDVSSANGTVFITRTLVSNGISHGIGATTLGGGYQLTLQADNAVFNAGSASTFTTGAVTLLGNATLNVVNSANTTMTLTLGALNDGGTARRVTLVGNGTVSLGTAATSLVAGTEILINSGTLRGTAASVFGSATINASGGTVVLSKGNVDTDFGGNLNYTSGNLVVDRGSPGTQLTHSMSSLSIGSVTLAPTSLNFTTTPTLGFGSTSITGNATFDASNVNFTLGSLNAAANTSLTTAGSNTTTAGATTLSGDFAISNNGTGVLNLNGGITGTGNLILNNNNSTADGITISTASANNTGTITNSGSGTGNVTISSAIGTNVTGVIQNSENSTLTLNGTNTYTGATTINAGTLQIGVGSTTGSLSSSSAITNNGTLVISRSNAITLSNTISGTGNLTQAGLGTLTLTGNNTYSGTTNINSGTLALSGNGTLGTSTITINGGELNMGGKSLANTLASLNGTLSNGTLTNNGGNFELQNGTVSAILAGTNGVNKTTAGTVTLSGNNTYAGATTISAGTLQIASGGCLGGGSYAGNISNSGNFIYSGTNNQTLSGIISGSGALTQNGTNSALTLTGSNTYTGITTVSGNSVLNIQHDNALGTTAGGTSVASGSALRLLGDITIAGETLTLSGSGLNVDNTGSLRNISGNNTWAGNINSSGATTYIGSDAGLLTLSGNISNTNPTYPYTFTGSGNILVSGNISGTSSSAVSKLGTGTLTLTGNNTFTGLLAATQGTVSISSIGNVGEASAAGAGTTINIGGTALSGTLLYTGSAATSNKTINLATGSAAYSSTITQNGTGLLKFTSNFTATTSGNKTLILNGSGLGEIAGAIVNNTGNLTHLTKNGTGTWTLSGNNTYTGATTVNGGTLNLTGSNTGSATTINSGGTLIGTGNAGAVTVNSGGIIGAGNAAGAVGTLTAGSLTINGGSGYTFTIGNVNSSVAGTDYDQISSAGALTLNNTAANPFTIYLDGTPTGWSNSGTYTWNLISAASQTGFNSGNFALDFTNFGIASGNRTGLWSFTNPSTGTVSLTYTASAGDAIWSGGTGNWSTGFSPAATTDKNLIFSGSGGNATNNIASGTLSSVNFITFNSTAGAYTLAANSGSAGNGTALTMKGDITNNSANTQTINMDLGLLASSTGIINTASGNISIGGVISGVGDLTKTGTGTLTLSSNNTYTGQLSVAEGTLSVATLNNSGAVGVLGNSTNSVILGSSGKNGTLSYTGGTTVSVNKTFTIAAGGTGVFDVGTSGQVTVGVISGSGAMSKTGAGNLVLGSANTYSGGTTLGGSGVVAIDIDSVGTAGAPTSGALGTGTVNLAGAQLRAGTTNNRTVANAVTISANTTFASVANEKSLTFTGPVTLSGATRTLNVGIGSNVTSSNLTFSGAIGDGGNGYGITKTGNGTLTLSGNNTYSGVTTISAGNLTISHANALGATGAGSGTSIASGAVLQLSNNITIGETISLNSTGISNGGGIRNTSGNNTISGAITSGASSRITSYGGNLTLTGGYTGNGVALSLGAAAANTSITVRDNAINLGAGGFTAFGTSTGSNIIVLGVAGNTFGSVNINYASTLRTDVANAWNSNATLVMGSPSGEAVGAANLLNLNGNSQAFASLTSYTVNSTSAITSASAATLTVNGSSSTTYNGTITGAISLVKAGSSTQTLAGNNTYSGNTTVAGGTLLLSGTGTLGTSTISITGGTLDMGGKSLTNTLGSLTAGTLSNGTLTNDGSDYALQNGTVSAILAGTNSVNKTGSGTVTLSGSNTYSGGTTISAGTLQVGHANALGTSGNITFSGGTMQFDSGGSGADYGDRIKNSASAMIFDTNGQSVSFSGAMDSSNTLGLTKNGTGTLTLSGANTYTGGTTINAGTLAISGATGSVVGTIAVGSSAVLEFGSSGTPNHSNNISGAGTIRQDGFGITTLSGTNTNTGVVEAIAGTLLFSGANALSATTASLNASNSSTLSFADGTGRTITLSTGTLSLSSATMVFELGAVNNTDRLTLTSGAVTLNGTNTISLANLGNFTAGTYTLISAASGLDTGGTWSLNTAGGPTGFSFSLASSATALTLTASASVNNFYWTGNASANWSGNNFSATDGGASTLSGSNLSANSDLIFAATGATNLAATLDSNYTVNSLAITTPGVSIDGNTLTLNSPTSSAIAVSAASGNTTISTNLTGASAGLTKANSGALILTGSNTYNGTTTVSGGVLNIQHANALGSTANGTTVAVGAALQLEGGITVGAEALSLAGSGVSADGALRNISGTNTYGGNITLAGTARINSDAGLLTLTGGISGSQDLTIGGDGNTAISNAIATSTGTLTKDGLGTLTLSGNNTYTGSTTVSAGTLTLSGRLNNSSVTVNGGLLNQTSTGSIAGIGRTFTLTSGNATLEGTNTYTGATTVTGGTLTLSGGLNNSSVTVNGGLLNQSSTGSIAGTGSTFSLTSGNATLEGTNTYTGATTVSGGTLTLSSGLNNSSVTVNGGLLNQTSTGRIAGTGSTFSLTSGNATLAGTNTYTGATTIGSTGRLEITSAGRLGSGSYAGNITNSGTFLYSGTNNQTLSGVVSGTGALTQNNSSSTLTLSGNNTYSGTTTINAGTLEIASTGRLGGGSYAGNITNSGTFLFSGTNNQTLSGIISGSGALTQNNSSTLTLTGNNTYTGDTTINAGTLQVASGGRLGGGSYAGNISNSGNFIYAGTNNQTLAGVISGSGALTRNGTNSTLTLTGSNTYTGITTVSGNSILNIQNNTALGGTANGTTVASGSALQLQNNITITGETLTLNGSGPGGNTGILRNISGNNEWQGNITLSAASRIHSDSGNLTLSGIISGANNLTIGGTSVVILSGANTYSGTTSIIGGTLSINTLADSADSSVGNGTGSISLGSGGSAGTLLYTGTGSSTNRTINLGGSAGNATIDQSGTGTLRFTSSFISGAGNKTLTLQGSTAGIGEIAGAVVNNSATNLTSLTKNGNGTWILSGFNTYTGTTTINAGTLQIGNGSSTGNLSASSAITNNATLVFNRSGTVTQGVDFANGISGTGNLTQAGPGNLIINAANSYTGVTTVSNGTLTLSGSGTLGTSTITITGGTLDLGGSSITNTFSSITGGTISNGTLTNNGGNYAFQNGTVSTSLAGTNGLTKTGSGTLTLNATNSYSGATTISAGNLSISSVSALTNTSGVNLANATSLIYTGGSAATLDRDISVTGTTGSTGTIRNDSAGLLTLSGALTKNGTTLALQGGSGGITVSGSIGGSNANSDLDINNGVVTLTAVNTYNGPTTIKNGATLNANITGALPTANGRSDVSIDPNGSGGSTLALGASQSIASLSGAASSNVTLGSNTLTIGTTSGSTTYDGRITGGSTSALVKDGASTQVLTGNNSGFTGTTTINSGTLQAAAAGALGGTSNIDMNGGSLLVAAANAINESADINLNGGTLAFGSAGYNGSVGALTLSADSIIDLGTSNNGVLIRFNSINWSNSNALLAIYNWTGTTQWQGGTGNNLDQVYFTNTTLSGSQMQRISFYSDFGQSFVGDAFQIQGGTFAQQIIAVPEAETYLTGVILLLGSTIYLFRRAKNREGHRPAWPKFLHGIRRTTPRNHLAQKPPDSHPVPARSR